MRQIHSFRGWQKRYLDAKFKDPCLTTVAGAQSKGLLVRDENVQLLHGCDTVASATAYLASDLFTHDVFVALKPLVLTDLEVRDLPSGRKIPNKSLMNSSKILVLYIYKYPRAKTPSEKPS